MEVVDGQLVKDFAEPTIAKEALTRLDATVVTLGQTAGGFVCETEAQYVRGGELIEQIRRLDKTFEEIYKPIKQAQDAAKQVTIDEEKSKRAPLATAKKTIGDAMSTWATAREAEARAIETALRERERLAAEERQLAVALELEAAGNAEAVEIVLSRPVAVAPVYVSPAVPKLSGRVHQVDRKVLEFDMPRFLISLGASLYLAGDRCTPLERAALAPYASKGLESFSADAGRCEKLETAVRPFLTALEKMLGARFSVLGVTVTTKKGLG